MSGRSRPGLGLLSRAPWRASASGRVLAMAIGALTAPILAGCAAPVAVPPAAFASDPVCAVVLQRAPQVLDGRDRRPTTSQASRAWGEVDPVVLRCGVPPPGPSTERCVRVEDAGTAVDWIAIEGEQAWTFVTYGRLPAVEVTVPYAVLGSGAQPTAVLVDLASAVAATAVERTCL